MDGITTTDPGDPFFDISIEGSDALSGNGNILAIGYGCGPLADCAITFALSVIP